jgi:DNA-binding GntR family transcriptional regulator
VSAQPAATQSLGDAAYQRLWADIVSCRLAPGPRITERSLAESTGFGISPIRDALTRLDHEGLVRTLPRKGYQVTPLTLKSVDDLFSLYAIVSPEVARLGVRDATPEQHRELIEIFSRIAEPYLVPGEITDEVRMRTYDLIGDAFGLLAAATQNDYFVMIYRRLRNDMARIWALTVQSGHIPDPGVDQHWVEMVERRDSEAAAALVRASSTGFHAHALRVFSRWPSVTASEITPFSG